jgi:hypothetical protein
VCGQKIFPIALDRQDLSVDFKRTPQVFLALASEKDLSILDPF